MPAELEATKAMTYSTRRLLPGDTFTPKTDRDARILCGIRKARPAPPSTPDRESLLAEAEKLGVQIDKRWGEKRLGDEIEKAKAAKAAETKGD